MSLIPDCPEGWEVRWDNIRAVQVEITRWAQQCFPHRTDHHAIYKLMVEEIPELAMHKKEHGTVNIGPELADCMILLLDLASLWNVDMLEALRAKMEINYKRTWNKDPETGIMQHVEPPILPPRLAEGTQVNDMTCPGCASKEIEAARTTSIYLYHCIQCGNEFDDDIPF